MHYPNSAGCEYVGLMGVSDIPLQAQNRAKDDMSFASYTDAGLVEDDDNPGLRFAYPGLQASPTSRPHMLRMSSHP